MRHCARFFFLTAASRYTCIYIYTHIYIYICFVFLSPRLVHLARILVILLVAERSR